MALSREERSYKQKMGQFMTPSDLSQQLLNNDYFQPNETILEPSFGEGAFIFAYIERMMQLFPKPDITTYVTELLEHNIYGVELDEDLYAKTLHCLQETYNLSPGFKHNLVNVDFFNYDITDSQKFDYIIGNPPFGGTFNHPNIDKLDKTYGFWNGYKIKKETYSFFISKSLKLMKPQGKLMFILSDTFITIKTMEGLRRLLVSSGRVTLNEVKFFSDETEYGMIVLSCDGDKNPTDSFSFNNKDFLIKEANYIPGFPFCITDELIQIYKDSATLSEYITASSGMTVGKNELFVRNLTEGKFIEPYDFTFEEEPITLEKITARYRHGKVPEKKLTEIEKDIALGKTERVLHVTLKSSPEEKEYVPGSSTYLPYNKSNPNEKYYTKVNSVVYWENEGEAVYTFKSQGSWYLHGVGGKPFFRREGLTWGLISSKIKAKYLPSGFILDSGAPIAVLKDGIPNDELYFILGWLWSDKSTSILKKSINHTRNIQGKDIERLPYPKWVGPSEKQQVIDQVKSVIKLAQENKISEADVIVKLINQVF